MKRDFSSPLGNSAYTYHEFMQNDRLPLYDNRDEYEEQKVLIVGKTSKRVLAGLCDYFIIVFVAMLFYALLGNIVMWSPLPAKANDDMTLVLAEQEKSGLVERNNEGDVKTEAQRIFTYTKKQVAYDGDSTGPDDAFYRYYCGYEAEEGKKLWTVEEYNEKILKADQSESFFISVAEQGKPAMINETMRSFLKVYVEAEYPEEIKDADVIKAYDHLSEFYRSTYQVAWKEFMTSKPVYNHFVDYTNHATTYYLTLTSMALVSYFLSCGIFLYLVPAIHKKGSTIGKKLMKLEPAMRDGRPVTWGAIFLRSTMDLFIHSSCLPLVPTFLFGVDGFTMPLIAIGTYAIKLSAFFIFGMLFAVTSLLFVAFRKDHLSLSGMVSQSQTFTTDMSIIAAERERIRIAEEQQRTEDFYGREN